MDAEKLPEVTLLETGPACGAGHPGCTGETSCAPAWCRPACSLEVVHALLSEGSSIAGEDADLLLDFHQLVKGRRDAETTLRVFCELRRRLERKEYLAFYRLRRWLEAHIVAEVRCAAQALAYSLPLRLNFYCVEAVRRGCLCGALNRGIRAPKLTLSFRYHQL